MCGIVGWYRRGDRPIPEGLIEAQCGAITHRGPDDVGTLVDRDFGFGMVRLSILDVDGGHQPILSPDGRYAIIFNGEIYNHRAIRDDLAGARYPFRTESDTETILAAFCEWGEGAWKRLEGMFAIAIWDRVRRRLNLVRDPLGIKPLYLSEQNGGLSFASELKALRLLPEHDFDVSSRAVHDFFSFGHVRQPRSIFEQVTMLEPGHSLSIGAAGASTTAAYWRPRFHRAAPASIEGWSEQMRTLLTETTARHMQSDVPVGAFLSGGIDSSAVLAAMRFSTRRPLKAFTVGYPGAAIDETAAAAEIARHLNCEHIVLPLSMAQVAEALPEILASQDEPFADMATIPTWFASRVAAEHVKVVLCGEGGDELFAGYKRHRNARMIERVRPVLPVLNPLCAMIDRMPASRSPRINYLRQHVQRFSEFIRLPDGYQQFFAATQTSGRSLRRAVYAREFWQEVEGEDGYDRLEQEYFPADGCRTESALEQFLFADLTLNMPSAMLTRLDRASMAHSLEARVPFLSHRVVDWALGVPEDLKLRRGTGKFVLREAVASWLPPSVMKRPKQGFQIPYAAWLRADLGDVARSCWYDSGAASAGYLDQDVVEGMFVDHKRGVANHGRLLYAIMVFSTWWQGSRVKQLATCG